MAEAGIGETYAVQFRPEWHANVADLADRLVDDSECAAFVDECERHAPWVWKDPRL
jgi:hypothetical protein